ncbi:MAG TPA: hypothetical protein VNO52_17845, partial [Methylomirabilota bacterium]|nr:hypothetical protein [Methylomirabilota bacterium]
LETQEQIVGAGLEPYLQPEGLAVVEWFERWQGPPPARLRRVRIEPVSESERIIVYEDSGV